MSGIIAVSYIIRPRDTLEKLLSVSGDHDWGHPQIWQINENLGYAGDTKHFYTTVVKVIFMLDKVVSGQSLQQDILMTNKLFGEPPSYKVETFDYWWSIERVGNIHFAKGVIKLAKSHHLEKIPKTGDFDVDQWLQNLKDLDNE